MKVFNLIEELEKNDFTVKLVTSRASLMFVLSVLLRKPKNIVKFLEVWETGFWEFLGAFSMEKGHVEHINLVRWADAILIAPATKNTIGLIAGGIDDHSFLVTIASAMPESKKIFIAPAMNVEMWNHPFFQENLRKLMDHPERYKVIMPVCGMLQCGDTGVGKMADVETIVRIVNEELG